MTDILWTRPADVTHATLLLAHGAGAAMDSSFMTRLAAALADSGVAVARFEFPYMAARRTGGKKTPPPKADLLVGAFQTAVQQVSAEAEGTFLIGGKSMGGRVAAMLAGSASLPGRVKGVVCVGYPFHPTGKADVWRLEPLEQSRRPVLITQGERDPFGSQAELAAVSLPEHVSLTYLEDGNHDLGPRGQSPATWDGNIRAAAAAVAAFARQLP
ncbi:alpha/beta hydrolase [Microvirga tunisiensis]|uniref:Alpha/beta hydrolase n=1 Tax=Pannonibacter tanglangensis TaxID=2750084 RepID=A0A7X5J8S6_9HYPH|nr:alpha/beta family hydrolase [Pannonibacter sp. XCT-53]NBN78827.1 alpha/beta hydrolase [Pannonibacter sp. XCT-53]